jgi:hypothetical protein
MASLHPNVILDIFAGDHIPGLFLRWFFNLRCTWFIPLDGCVTGSQLRIP